MSVAQPTPYKPRRERSWPAIIPVSLWVIGTFYVIANLIGLVSYPLIAALRNAGIGLDPNVLNVVLSAVIYSVVLLVVLGFPRLLKLWSSRVSYRELLGLTRMMTWRDIGYALVGAVVYIALFVALWYVLRTFVPAFDAGQKQETGFSSVLNSTNAILVFFALVVLAPVVEEIIFRGYLFGTLRRCAPVIVATLVTSVLFGYIHGQWNVAVDVFVMSVVSCYLRVKTGALWSSILLHMTKNAFAFYLLYVATRSIM